MTTRHGSESFFIEGEGLVNTQVGGRHGDQPDPITDPGAAPPTLAADAVPPFRFSRVGPKGKPLRPLLLARLAEAMVVGGGGHGHVPAGYTYLGQFVDHDLTMDRTDVALGEDVSVVDLLQARSPAPRPRLAVRRRAGRQCVG